MHAPPTHVWLTHPIGAPHVPLASQACTPLPEHRVEPGAHATHAFMHGAAAPHVPFDVHDCTPLPLHCDWPGAHVPVQAPPTHVWFTHATGAPQVPHPLQIWTPLPEHCVDPGEHSTQELFKQVGVAPVQVDCVCQLPVPSQDWMAEPRHCVSPGAHPPVHTPAMHVCLEHAAPLVHVPFEVHVCGVLPLH